MFPTVLDRTHLRRIAMGPGLACRIVVSRKTPGEFFHQSCDDDYRVVVVGDQTFAARCKPQLHQQIDIRRGSSKDHGYIPCSFDEKQIEALKKLMAKFDLSYCSADFMEDADGNLYFLDLNSCGAWWWIDELYAGEIRNTICDHLLSILQAG